jgi:hypothetical protein
VAHGSAAPTMGGGGFAERRSEMIPSMGRLGLEWPR